MKKDVCRYKLLLYNTYKVSMYLLFPLIILFELLWLVDTYPYILKYVNSLKETTALLEDYHFSHPFSNKAKRVKLVCSHNNQSTTSRLTL